MKVKGIGKRLSFWQILCFVFILATLVFIWSNSLKDATVSGAQSGAIGGWFSAWFDVTKEPFRFFYQNLRKVAHFAEFALLGGELGCLFVRVRKRAPVFFGSFVFFLLVAMLDEGIQYFTPGRVASLFDVGIDVGGALFGYLFVLMGMWLVSLIFKKK